MVSRNLIRRLQKLESRLQSDDESLVITIKFVAPDGRVVDQMWSLDLSVPLELFEKRDVALVSVAEYIR